MCVCCTYLPPLLPSRMEKTALLIFPSQFCCACGAVLQIGFKGLNLPSDFMLYLWRKGPFVWIFLLVCPPFSFFFFLFVLKKDLYSRWLFSCFLPIWHLELKLLYFYCKISLLSVHVLTSFVYLYTKVNKLCWCESWKEKRKKERKKACLSSTGCFIA